MAASSAAESVPVGTCVVLVTAPTRAVAESVALALVEAECAACVNVLPDITSIYRWEGAVQREVEVLLVVKTVRASVGRVMERVRALHPYEVPEVVVLPIVAGLPAYLRWVAANSVAGNADGA